jgi:hypothetical protein
MVFIHVHTHYEASISFDAEKIPLEEKQVTADERG